MTKNAETHIKALYESVGRGFESLPSHQERPIHIVYGSFFIADAISSLSERLPGELIF